MNVLIYGLPKSGTTFAFASVCEALPNNARNFERPTFVTQDDLNRGLTAKMVYDKAGNLDYMNGIASRCDKIIQIIRDPRDRLVSSILYAPYNLVTGPNKQSILGLPGLIRKKEEDPDSVSCAELVAALGGKDYYIPTMGKELDLIAGDEWGAKRGKPVLTVSYEGLMDGIAFDSISDFLGVKVKPTVKTSGALSRVSRSKRTGDWKNWLTINDVRDFNPIACTNIAHFRYLPNWMLPARQVIEPQFGSEFAQAQIDRRLKQEQK